MIFPVDRWLASPAMPVWFRCFSCKETRHADAKIHLLLAFMAVQTSSIKTAPIVTNSNYDVITRYFIQRNSNYRNNVRVQHSRNIIRRFINLLIPNFSYTQNGNIRRAGALLSYSSSRSHYATPLYNGVNATSYVPRGVKKTTQANLARSYNNCANATNTYHI